MEIYSVLQWIYPLLDFTVMILCLVYLRGNGALLLGGGFFIQGVMSLASPFFEIFDLYNEIPQDIIAIVPAALYVMSITFFISGILAIAADKARVTVNASAVPNNTVESHYNQTQDYNFGSLLSCIIPFIFVLILILLDWE